MGFLSTADAFMTETGHDRNDSDLAVIDLLRADVRLREAEGTVIRNDSAVTLSEVKLRVYEMFGKRPELSQCYPDISESRERRAGEEVYKLFDGCDQMRRARALVEDSIQYLDRAERSLRQRRRNVWWTTWLFDRRLRAIALSIWTSVTEPGSSIPYLGLDSTPRLRDTLADTLLDDTIRMVRLDMYRLATAVEAYADCAFALKVRLLCDAGSNWNHPRLPSRQEAMMRRIEFATKTMAEVRRDRIMVGHESSREPGKRRKRGAPSNNDLLDPRVKYYFDQVGANVAQICGFLDGSYYANSAIAQAMDVPDVEEDSD